jgi:ubiquinone/menaquinone biosynthesis C-methylase UbiE
LDIATGYGEPSITAAKYIQARDSVLDVDISAQMLEIAKERATNRGCC